MVTSGRGTLRGHVGACGSGWFISSAVCVVPLRGGGCDVVLRFSLKISVFHTSCHSTNAFYASVRMRGNAWGMGIRGT